jgi:hypothetical protein
MTRDRVAPPLLSEMKVVPRVSRPYWAFSVLGFAGICALACSSGPNDGPINPGQTGGSSNGGGGGAGGAPGPVDLSKGGPKLRVLTRAEYKASIAALFGAVGAQLELPKDLLTDGFSSIGATEISINTPSAELYEDASRKIVAEVFGDAARWPVLVGCQPAADLSDACVTTFIQTFGKRAFRRELSADVEVPQWLKVGKDVAGLPGSSAAQGLSTIVSGMLQSPYFLYRVEVNKLDASSGRLKYDGPSMATRLAFLLTGGPPNDALLAAAAAGQLDTPDGVKTAAAPLLNDPNALDRMALFFNELAQTQLVMDVQKSTMDYPSFSPALQASMLQGTQLFIKNVVLGANADVRSFYDSDQFFVDANLAPVYGVAPPASGFAQVKLGPEAGRAGIFGQAAVLAGHSLPDHTSPTRRGIFISSNFLCLVPNPPPAGVIPELPNDPTKSARQKLDVHRTIPSCASCHAIFDPLGFGLEHLDSIGDYRETEHGLTIDATGTLDGVNYNGGAQMGAAFRQSARALNCLVSNFYRSATGRVSAVEDSALIDNLDKALAGKGYVWRELVTEFVASDAFRSAPAAPVTAGNK